ncbi:MAG TPA: anti-sigma factor [Solirubrobacteraceae bacterium]|jgi:hypothetical protein|nr:anti-sigma factor [Solirubrobacteraceae bacterium]
MSTVACARVDDAASYVLRAMPDGEWEQYEAHVAGCSCCAEKIDELSFVSHALLSAAPQLSAPPEIRSRVMSVVRAESELLLAAGAMADRPVVREQRRFSLLRLRPWPAAALASALLVLGIGAGTLLGGGSSDPAARRVACVQAPTGSTCAVSVSGAGAKLVVAGLQAPPAGRIYEVWLDRADGTAPQPTEALFSVRKGHASVDVPGNLHGVKRVLVTDEPLGGSEVPTRQPVIAARLA